MTKNSDNLDAVQSKINDISNDFESFDFLFEWKNGLSEQQIAYNYFRSPWARLAQNAANVFSNQYDLEIKNLDALVQKSPQIAHGLILSAMEKAVADLISRDIHETTLESFISEFYQKYDQWTSAFEPLEESLSEIQGTAQELDEYRRNRRLGRGRLSGGGFGVAGAAQGMAMAGAANMATGMLHGTFNLLAKGVSAVGDSLKKSAIFNNPETKKTLVMAVHDSVLNIHLALLDAYQEYSIDFDFDVVSLKNTERAERILTNLQRGVIESDIKKPITQALSLDPYLKPLYLFLLERLGDRFGNLEKIANNFNVDLQPEKLKILSCLIPKDIDEENVTEEIKEKVLQESLRLGIDPENEFTKKIQDLLNEKKALDEEDKKLAEIKIKKEIERKKVLEKIEAANAAKKAAKAAEKAKSTEARLVEDFLSENPSFSKNKKEINEIVEDENSKADKNFILRSVVNEIITKNQDKIWVAPGINEAKSKINAFLKKAKDFQLNFEDFVLYYDDTLFGKGDNGVLITDSYVIYCEFLEDPIAFSLFEMKDAFICDEGNLKAKTEEMEHKLPIANGSAKEKILVVLKRHLELCDSK